MSDDQYEVGVETSVSGSDLIGESVSEPTTHVETTPESSVSDPIADGSQPVAETVSELETLRAERDAFKRDVEAKEKLARLHQSRADKLQAEWGPKIQEAERIKREQEASRFSTNEAFQAHIDAVGYVQAHADLASYQANQVAQAAQQQIYEQQTAQRWEEANVEFYKTANGMGYTNEQADAIVAPYRGFSSLGDPALALDACKQLLKANAPAKSAEAAIRAAETRVRQLAAQQNPKATTGTSIGGETSGVGDAFFAGIDKARERHGLRDII